MIVMHLDIQFPMLRKKVWPIGNPRAREGDRLKPRGIRILQLGTLVIVEPGGAADVEEIAWHRDNNRTEAMPGAQLQSMVGKNQHERPAVREAAPAHGQ